MKYPQQQFDTLVECLKILAPFLDIKNCNLHALHYLVAQQFNEGQKHNWAYSVGSDIKKAHQLTGDDKEAVKLLDMGVTFDLYPDGCNDSHIETAMKRAIKELGI